MRYGTGEQKQEATISTALERGYIVTAVGSSTYEQYRQLCVAKSLPVISHSLTLSKKYRVVTMDMREVAGFQITGSFVQDVLEAAVKAGLRDALHLTIGTLIHIEIAKDNADMLASDLVAICRKFVSQAIQARPVSV